MKSTPNLVRLLLLFLLLADPSNIIALSESQNSNSARARTRALLERLNKPYLKSIQSADGDVIDCVPSHLQPAFDHPMLRGQKPLDPPERPRRSTAGAVAVDVIQLWREGGDACPEGTVAIRRTKEEDLRRVAQMGRKTVASAPPSYNFSSHEHSVGYVRGNLYFGAQAIFNVWQPTVANPGEFSLSQLWLITGDFGTDLNTIEVGWQVYPDLYGDSSPRLFVYWTNNSYQSSGCYNLLCPGFVQTSNDIAVGAAINSSSIYGGPQYESSIAVWRDNSSGSWWLQLGSTVVGYWPAFLFSKMGGGATMVDFGGEVINSRPAGNHTATQMGSGHYAAEGFGKAAYIRNIGVLNETLGVNITVQNLTFITEAPACYNVQGAVEETWGAYFFFGGPGRSDKCP